MLRKQQTPLSSSSRRHATTTPPPSETHHVVKSIGCMSGIFQLFSKYQNPHKRLTLGNIFSEKRKPSSPKKAKEMTLLLDSLRSPMLPPEIRLSNAATNTSSESPRTSSCLVKKLMGLEDNTINRLNNNEAHTSSSLKLKGKRGEMLQAVQKCNEDLEELKRIILALKSSTSHEDVRLQTPKDDEEVNGELMISPVSVLDECMTRSPHNRISKVLPSSSSSIIQGSVRAPLQSCCQPTLAPKKPMKDDELIAKYMFLSNFSTTTNILPMTQMRQHVRSKAMVQSVEEVCSDLICGEDREIRRIGLVLQDNLCKDLVEELVQELDSFCTSNSLPLQGCKRKLCF